MQKTDKLGLNLIEVTDTTGDSLAGLNENFAALEQAIEEAGSSGGGESGGGGITNETDPTVPQYVKEIQESDIENWNDKYSKEEIDNMIGDIESVLQRINSGEGV